MAGPSYTPAGMPERRIVAAAGHRDIVIGGPWAFRRQGEVMLWQIVAHCRSTSCRCREIDVRAVLVDNLDAYAEEGGRLLLWYSDGAEHRPPSFLGKVGSLLRERPPGRPPAAQLRARIEFNRGRVELSPAATSDERDELLLPRIERELDGEILDHLYDEFRHAQGYAIRTSPQTDDWAWWRPGQLVNWSRAYPDARHDQYEIDGSVYCAHDAYCVRPGCPCNTIGIQFCESRNRHESIGAAKLHLNTGKLVKLEAGGAPRSTIAELWERFQARHSDLAFLQRRSGHLVERIGPRLYRTGYQPKAEPHTAVVARNAPCPCGSGLKFKKCCGAKAEQSRAE
jgi:hypothetical protein